jgi:hypothetical protein
MLKNYLWLTAQSTLITNWLPLVHTPLASEKPVMCKLHTHTPLTIRLGLAMHHHAARRHARCRCPSARARRESNHRAQLRAWFDAPCQPHIEPPALKLASTVLLSNASWLASTPRINTGKGLSSCVYRRRSRSLENAIAFSTPECMEPGPALLACGLPHAFDCDLLLAQ